MQKSVAILLMYVKARDFWVIIFLNELLSESSKRHVRYVSHEKNTPSLSTKDVDGNNYLLDKYRSLVTCLMIFVSYEW
jgi:hypothetical protein